jgi:hypothetical protein
LEGKAKKKRTFSKLRTQRLEYIPPDASKPPHSLEAREQRRAKGELAALRQQLGVEERAVFAREEKLLAESGKLALCATLFPSLERPSSLS